MRIILQHKENETQSSIDERRGEAMIQSNIDCITTHRKRKDIISNGMPLHTVISIQIGATSLTYYLISSQWLPSSKSKKFITIIKNTIQIRI